MTMPEKARPQPADTIRSQNRMIKGLRARVAGNMRLIEDLKAQLAALGRRTGDPQ